MPSYVLLVARKLAEWHVPHDDERVWKRNAQAADRCGENRPKLLIVDLTCHPGSLVEEVDRQEIHDCRPQFFQVSQDSI